MVLFAACGSETELETGTEVVCNGLDDDHDGEVDEDALDNDGDGLLDCFEEEICDGEDNNGDGVIDEGFVADTDGDGVLDCIDVEVCDGLDNDGDGEVDEDAADTDEDGVPDCLDTEECDGLDNDGDGEVDEAFGDSDADGTADCMDGEGCDGLDNDGDGEVDEGFDTDGDGIPDCEGSCPWTKLEVNCTIDLTDGTQDCNGPSDMDAIPGTGGGWVFRVDISAWDTLIVDADVTAGAGWILTVGNSPSNDGEGGDAGDFFHDSEAQIVDDVVSVFANDAGAGGLVATWPGALNPIADHVTLFVCEQAFSVVSSTTARSVVDPNIFRVDSGLVDSEHGTNDSVLWVGVERVVDTTDASRLGDGVENLVITVARD